MVTGLSISVRASRIFTLIFSFSTCVLLAVLFAARFSRSAISLLMKAVRTSAFSGAVSATRASRAVKRAFLVGLVVLTSTGAETGVRFSLPSHSSLVVLTSAGAETVTFISVVLVIKQYLFLKIKWFVVFSMLLL